MDKETLRRELKEAFRLFDKEVNSFIFMPYSRKWRISYKKGNGYISTTTLKELLREIAPDLSDKDLDAAVDEIDEDGSGKIEFEGSFWDMW